MKLKFYPSSKKKQTISYLYTDIFKQAKDGGGNTTNKSEVANIEGIQGSKQKKKQEKQ